jgi:hypothetical protein
MSATELEDVQALIERVLPDPRGFAGRLLQQAITQYGLLPEPAPAAAYMAEDVMPGDEIIVADAWPADEVPADEVPVGQAPADQASADINLLVAAALGACTCWGWQPDCDLCHGQGTVGWAEPDPELFDEFVRPATERIAAMPPGGRRHDRPGPSHDDQQTVQGEDA